MLRESLVYALSYRPTPLAFRPYLVDAIGLWARGIRQRDAWAPHLARTRAIIEAAAAQWTSPGTVAVLGSGPLFDVPLEVLAARFARVLLVDVAHLSTTARQVAAHPQVERVWRDLAPGDDPAPLAFLNDVPDLRRVISVNLVSQIGRAAPEGRERAVIDAHLDGLLALPVPVTLVTDTGYRVLDRAGSEIERFDLLHGRPMPPPSEHWEWNVAPFGEESARTRRVHTVTAFPDWHAANGRPPPR